MFHKKCIDLGLQRRRHIGTTAQYTPHHQSGPRETRSNHKQVTSHRVLRFFCQDTFFALQNSSSRYVIFPNPIYHGPFMNDSGRSQDNQIVMVMVDGKMIHD